MKSHEVQGGDGGRGERLQLTCFLLGVAVFIVCGALALATAAFLDYRERRSSDNPRIVFFGPQQGSLSRSGGGGAGESAE